MTSTCNFFTTPNLSYGFNEDKVNLFSVNRGESEQSGDRQSQPELDEAEGRVNGDR